MLKRLFIIVSVVCLMTAAPHAEGSEGVGKITSAEGFVDVLKEGRSPGIAARIGTPVFLKDVVRTKSGAKAEITFNDGNILRIAQRSRIDISEYAGDGSGIIKLPRGKVQAVVPQKIGTAISDASGATRFKIQTPNAIAGVRGTDFFVFHGRNTTGVIVKEGIVDVYNPLLPRESVLVKHGHLTVVHRNTPPQLPKNVTDAMIRGHEDDVMPIGKESTDNGENGGGVEANGTDSNIGSDSAAAPTATDAITVVADGSTPPVSESNPDTLQDFVPPTLSVSGYSSTGISISSSEHVTLSYNLDGNTVVISGDIFSIPLSDGHHTLTLTAYDDAGNSSTTSLTFDFSTYALSGSCRSNLLGISSGTASGQAWGVANTTYGGLALNLSGTGYIIPSAAWQISAGGTSSDNITSNSGGYWTAVVSGTSDSSTNGLSGTTTIKYLSPDRIGEGSGTASGRYDGLGNYYLDIDVTSYYEQYLKHSGRVVNDSNGFSLYSIYSMIDGWTMQGGGSITGGLMGGVDSPWSGATSITYMGSYSTTASAPFVWTSPVYSYNIYNSTQTTYDGGAYFGLMGGTWQNDSIDSMVYSIYVDPSGNAGILRGKLWGGYSGTGIFGAEGIWEPTSLATGVSPSSISGMSSSPAWSGSGLWDHSGSILTGGYLNTGAANSVRYALPGQDWGIWQNVMGGTYTGPAAGLFSHYMTQSTSTGVFGTGMGANIAGFEYDGKTSGYYASISGTPSTGILVGETIGTFNPSNYSWQSVQEGVFMDTNKFLSMVSSNPMTLQQLGIPAVEVGRTNLSGSGNNLTVSMTDVIFFAPSTGQVPSIWATGNVSGTYSAAPSLYSGVSLTNGSGLSATFTPTAWTGTNWMALINGSGTISGGSYNGSVTMRGVGAGTISGVAPTFSGTAAGTAR